MRSVEKDNTLTQSEVALILGVSARYVRDLAMQGVLNRVGTGRYDANEVHALADIRRMNLSLPDIAMMSKRAELSARRSERVVKQLMEVFGLGSDLISLEDIDVLALHGRVEDALLLPGIMTETHRVSEWASIFNAMGEEYLEAVAMYTPAREEPWAPYVELSNKIMREAPREALKYDNALRLAYECLQRARNNLVATSYNYAKRNNDKVLALKAFPEAKGDVHETILEKAAKLSRKR